MFFIHLNGEKPLKRNGRKSTVFLAYTVSFLDPESNLRGPEGGPLGFCRDKEKGGCRHKGLLPWKPRVRHWPVESQCSRAARRGVWEWGLSDWREEGSGLLLLLGLWRVHFVLSVSVLHVCVPLQQSHKVPLWGRFRGNQAWCGFFGFILGFVRVRTLSEQQAQWRPMTSLSKWMWTALRRDSAPTHKASTLV